MIKAIARPLWMSCCAIALLPQGGYAQTYPSKPVRLLIPYPPGGASDFVGRTIAAKLGEQLREQVVIDNRGGGGGSIAIEIAAKATPDGPIRSGSP